MASRVGGIVVVWVLLLMTAWAVEPYVVAALFSAAAPRLVEPRGTFTAPEQVAIDVFKRDSPSVVHVFAQSNGGWNPFEGSEETVLQTGSGVIWDAAGHVVTNFHVIRGTDQIGARLSSGEFVNTRVVGIAPNYDLAVLQLIRPRTALRPIALGRSDNLLVGQTTYALGNPYGLTLTMTNGIVSALHRHLPSPTQYEIANVIQTDAPINPGNSGGPLLDDAGRMIGLNSAILSGSGASAGIGFAIPVDLVNRVVPELIRNGHAATPGIGILAANESTANRLGVDGVIVLRTLPGSPAAAAGIVGAEGDDGTVQDVIIAANGKPVHDMAALTGIFQQLGVGKTVELTVQRDGQTRQVPVQIGDISQPG